MRYVSYAQEYEDIVLYAILGDVWDGFYIDIGANDPSNMGVTKFFYDRGWHGINVEPLREQCMLLEQERPKDINLCVGVGNLEDCKIGMRPMYERGGLSTFDSSVASKMSFDKTDEKHFKPMMNLTDIHRLYCTPYQTIHFCKIDVEGYERRVLEGILDWEIFRPWIFVIETTKPETLIPSYGEWEAILTAHQYMYAYHFGCNRYYIDSRKSHLLEKANRIDSFFEENEIVRMRMFGRRRKRLKERIVVFGLGEEFEANVDRILTRSYIVACSDNHHRPQDSFWLERYVEPEKIPSLNMDKILICTWKHFTSIQEQLLGYGIPVHQLVDIEYLRFDHL